MSVHVLYFQVSDLQYASPATVSRCGMVFVDPKNLGYEPYWKRWLAGKFYYSNIHVMYPWQNIRDYKNLHHDCVVQPIEEISQNIDGTNDML